MRSLQIRRCSAIACGVVLAVAATAFGQGVGVHPVSGRQIAATMSVEGAPWLERAEREDEEEPSTALRVLKIAKGATVADIGAGSGFITRKLAKIVGPTGRVYAEDIQPGMIDILERNIARAKITNVTPVLGAIDDPKLPAESLDLVMMVDVYHELTKPQAMLGHIRDALKSGGRLVLLEYRGEDPSIPILPLHKMTVAQAKLEVEHEGFTLASVKEDLPRQHILIFMKK